MSNYSEVKRHRATAPIFTTRQLGIHESRASVFIFRMADHTHQNSSGLEIRLQTTFTHHRTAGNPYRASVFILGWQTTLIKTLQHWKLDYKLHLPTTGQLGIRIEHLCSFLGWQTTLIKTLQHWKLDYKLQLPTTRQLGIHEPRTTVFIIRMTVHIHQNSSAVEITL